MVEIHRIPVPGPEKVGDVNAYLVKGEKKVLVDPGPGTGEAFEALSKGLEEEDVPPEKLDMILVTHPHSDHFGNVSRLKKVSGAETLIHREAKEIVRDYEGYREELRDYFADYFRKMGMPEEEAHQAVASSLPGHGEVSFEPDRVFEDGDTVDAGESIIRVMHTPGHAAGATCFRIKSEGKIITGDTVLEGISPNPMLQMPRNGDRPPRSLELYLQSLEKLKSLDGEEALPGHGPAIDDVRERVLEIEKHHEERLETVLELIDEPVTAFHVMEQMFPGLEKEGYFFGMSEAVGHLELLVARGKAERKEGSPVTYCSS